MLVSLFCLPFIIFFVQQKPPCLNATHTHTRTHIQIAILTKIKLVQHISLIQLDISSILMFVTPYKRIVLECNRYFIPRDKTIISFFRYADVEKIKGKTAFTKHCLQVLTLNSVIYPFINCVVRNVSRVMPTKKLSIKQWITEASFNSFVKGLALLNDIELK